jgi:hypothetical protein
MAAWNGIRIGLYTPLRGYPPERSLSRGFAMATYQPFLAMVKGDPETPEAVEFFRFVGMCVCAWAFVDRHLYRIFHHAIGFQPKQSAFIYYRQRAFNSRLRLVDDALKMFLPTRQFQEEWKPLYTRVDDLAAVRNIFAHHPPMKRDGVIDGKPIVFYSIHIEPHELPLNNEYKGLRGKLELDLGDLKTHEKEVDQLHHSLDAFAWVVGGLRAAAKTS